MTSVVPQLEWCASREPIAASVCWVFPSRSRHSISTCTGFDLSQAPKTEVNVGLRRPECPLPPSTCATSLRPSGRFTRGDRANGWRSRSAWSKSQAEKRAGIGRFVLEKVRRSPLVGRDEIEPAIAIDIGDGDASADHRFSHAESGAMS